MIACLWAVMISVDASEIEFYSEQPGLTILDSGTCGDTAYWYLDSAYVLYIYGEGAMTDYEHERDVPWFNYRMYLNDVVVAEGITHICDYAFYGSTRLGSAKLPFSLLSIGSEAFFNCNNSELWDSFVLPEGLLSIGPAAFSYCYDLESITLPSTLENIGAAAFVGCRSLQVVNVLSKFPPVAGNNMFLECPTTFRIYVPSNFVTAYELADGWCDYAEFIVGGVGIGSGSDAGGSGGGCITDGENFMFMNIDCARSELYWGDQLQFYVNYSWTPGWPEFDTGVVWKVNNATAAGTMIDENGLLTIGIGEDVMAGLLSVTATNVEYPGVSTSCVIKIHKSERPNGETPSETLSPVEQEQFDKLSGDIADLQSSIDGLQSGGEAGSDLTQDSSQITDSVGQIDEFEQSQMDVLDGSVADMKDKVTFSSFVPALVFVQKYLDLSFAGISGIGVIFYLPMFLGLFFYLCSRVPYGATKARGSRPPKSGKR